MSYYNFEIREIDNGWLLERNVYTKGEYYSTLNELCDEILRYVHDTFPSHRNTKQKEPNENPKT